MPESKKDVKTTPRNFEAPINSQIDGVRLVAKKPLPPAQDGLEEKPGDGTGPEPALVSKLIDFIKKI